MVGKRKETRHATSAAERATSSADVAERNINSAERRRRTWSQYVLCPRGLRAVIHYIQKIYSTISIIE